MGLLEKCFDYACPYDPAALESQRPKYRASKLDVAKGRSCYIDSSDPPPPYAAQEPKRSTRHESASRASRAHYCRDSQRCFLCRSFAVRQKLTRWLVSQRKPYTAVTVQIDRLTGEQYDEDDIGGIPDLVEVVRIQGSGPTEAARAIRKKLYANSVHPPMRI